MSSTTPRKRTAALKKPVVEPGKPYHHGDLPQALLAAAEVVLVRDGLAGLGLRSIAREAGVSHTAPKHHFGDTAALLSELAAVGYRRLADAMLSAAEGIADPGERRRAVGSAYIHFALDNPAMFGLMFRNEITDIKHPVLAKAARDAMRVMAPAIGGASKLPASKAPTDLSAADAMRLTAAWAYVHGLATLLIDQRLRGIVKATPAFKGQVELVDAVMREVRLGLDFAEAGREE